MSDNKKYYYLKLKENFYDRPEIKIIEKMAGGYEYICILLKMYLKSICLEGRLMINENIPYDLSMLSSALGHDSQVIKDAVEIFIKFKLCEIMSDRTIYMTDIQTFIGQSSTEADRIRNYRERIKNHNVQIPYKCTPELELKLELEKEKKKEKKTKKKKNSFIPPTLQEAEKYCKEKGYCIDVEYVHNYYSAKDWMIGSNKMSDWKKAFSNSTRWDINIEYKNNKKNKVEYEDLNEFVEEQLRERNE